MLVCVERNCKHLASYQWFHSVACSMISGRSLWVCPQVRSKINKTFSKSLWPRYVLVLLVSSKYMKYTLTSRMSPSVMSLTLYYSEVLGNGCARFKSPSLLSHFPSMYHGFWHYNNPPKNSKHTLACITLSHATLSLYYHASMLTLQISLISCALRLPQARY